MQGTFRPGRRHSDGRAIDRTRSRSPGSRNPAHIRDNFDLFDFTLTTEEMDKITDMDKQKRYYTSTPEMLKRYAEMVPDVDGQK